DEEGKVLQTKTNDSTGQIYFDELVYKEAGEHHYTIREKAGADSTITYDTKEYQVTVNVKDQAGKLIAEVVQKEPAVFNNQVKTTKQDDANVPNTPNRNTPVLPNLPNRNTPVLPSMPSRDTKSLPNTINRNTPNLPKTNETTKIGWIVLGIILLVVTVVVIYFTRKQRKLF
ncbi:Spy0128 family protein, partial [Enterococcus villorum]